MGGDIPLKHKLLAKHSEKLSDEHYSIPVYQIKLVKHPQAHESSVRVYEYGEAPEGSEKKEKVALLVGGTGVGKTTFIDTLVNFLLDVEYKDNFRFKLVPERVNISQAHSQTRNVTVYRLHLQEDFGIPYTLTIIDTPGFGDTEGIERDNVTVDQIYDFFDQDIVDHIDIIGFVEKATARRLTPTQKYIFESIQALFGKDIAKNIVLLLTFSDAKKPRKILTCIKEAGVNFSKHFCFNNSAVFPESLSHGEESEDDDDDDDDLSQIFWSRAMTTFQEFKEMLERVPAKGLTMSKEVLERRKNIKQCNRALFDCIQSATFYLGQLKREIATLKRHEADVEENQYFTYEVQELENTQNRLPDRYWTHMKRAVTSLVELIPFVRLSPIPYRYEQRTVTRIGVYADKKRKYEEAVGHTLSVKQVIVEIQRDFDRVARSVMDILIEMRENMNELEKIALKPNVVSIVEYIDVLIAQITTAAKPGWQSQVEELGMFRKLTKQLMEVKTFHYDPFKEFCNMNETPGSTEEGTLQTQVRAIWYNCRPHWFI